MVMNYKSCRNNILLLCCRSSNRRLIGKIGLKSCSLALVWCGQAQLDPMLRDRVAGRALHFLDGMDFGLHCGGKPKSHKQPGDTTSPGISCLSEINRRKEQKTNMSNNGYYKMNAHLNWSNSSKQTTEPSSNHGS